MIYKVAFTTDIRKMYNAIELDQDYWGYQRYLWEKDLDPTKIPEEKVIKTLIYGVWSSGNQAECGLRKIASALEKTYPKACRIIQNDMYVDDCISGDHSKNAALTRSEELETVVNHGGFQLKGVVLSGEDPPESMSDDGCSVLVAGMQWFPKENVISVDARELNFAKKKRGKKPPSSINIFPTQLTRRHCASKVAEVFDLAGRLTPITASLKMDLHELVIRHLDWDDQIPDSLQPFGKRISRRFKS